MKRRAVRCVPIAHTTRAAPPGRRVQPVIGASPAWRRARRSTGSPHRDRTGRRTGATSAVQCSAVDEDLAYADVFTLHRRGISAQTLVEGLLDRIAALDAPDSPTALRSVLAVSDAALQEAHRCDETGPTGPLHGIPILVKDNIEVAGLPSTAGSTSLSGRPARVDAPLVRRLRDAGAIILGTTNLSEWANIRSVRSTAGWSAVGGLTSNPWALDRSPGGSSSGSGAAVAAGFAPLAIGTETDGSITYPASLNGVAGIKPTVGAVPTGGVVPISVSQDSPGPFARTVDEVALLLEVLTATPGILDRARQGVGGIRVGVVRTWRTGHPATDELFDETAARLAAAGATLTDVTAAVPGSTEEEDELTVMLCELIDGLAAYLPTRGSDGPQSLPEVIAHEQRHASVELAHFGNDLFERAVELGGCGIPDYGAARARNLAWAVDTCLAPALAGVDVLIAPTSAPAWKSDLVLGGHPALASPVTTAPAIAGWPIATSPMGLVEGLPVGMGVVGRPGSEALLLAVARAVEQPARPTWRLPGRG
jgi:amidase